MRQRSSKADLQLVGGTAPRPAPREFGRQRQPAHRADHLVGQRRFDAEPAAKLVASPQGELPVAPAQLLPAARQQAAHEADRLRHAEYCRRVVSADPVELEVKARRSARVEFAPWLTTTGRTRWRRSRRTCRKALPWARTTTCGSCREVAAPSSSSESSSMPGACAPSTRVSMPRPASSRHQLPDRQHETGLARHVVKKRDPSPSCDLGQHRLDDLVRRGDRKRHRHDYDRPAGAPGHELEGVAAGVVLVVRGQQLVTRSERQRLQDRVDARGRVAHPRQILRRRTHERRQLRPGRVQQRLQLPRQDCTGCCSIRSRSRR